MRLTSTQLSLLIEVERTGSLAQAALHLGVTASAISQQLAKLEQTVGLTLVERSSKGARVTRLGAELAEHGRRIEAELAAAESTLDTFTGAYRERLRVGAPPSLSIRLLPDALAAARFRTPAANLSVIEVGSEEGVTFVADGTLDLALAASYVDTEPSSAVDLHPVMDEPMVVALADDHRLADGTDPIPLAELADEEWVSGALDRPLRRQLDQAGSDAGFVPRVPFVTESFDVAQSLVDVGVAVALIPASAVTRGLRTVTRPVAPQLVRRVFAVTPAQGDVVPLAPAFLADLSRVAQGLIAHEDMTKESP